MKDYGNSGLRKKEDLEIKDISLPGREKDTPRLYISAEPDVPHLSDIQEPQMVVLIGAGRAGTKFLQSYLDDHKDILMIPGYPLLYLYPHFDNWCKQFSENLLWDRIIDLFCEKHASVLDSRKVPGLSGLERLGLNKDQHIEINEEMFRRYLKIILKNVPIKRRSFLLAVHYTYGLCKQWDLRTKKILLYHMHDPQFLPKLVEDFPALKLVCMTRNPQTSLHSMVRSFTIVDQAKLNFSDSLRLTGRNFWLACYQQFYTFNHLRNYLEETQAVAVRLENLQDIEQTMRPLADWLGVDFSESMLKSTFDGKIWWGDVATTKQTSGFNADILSDNWKKSISRFDLFVIEGIYLHFFEMYNYDRLVYKHDTSINRLLLIFAILALGKAEWHIIGFYFDPRTHMRFIRAAFNESGERALRKDYTWNATYLYKWTYRDLRLWRKRWYEKFIDFTNGRLGENPHSLYVSGLITFGRILYTGVQYIRFWIAIFIFPVHIFRRWRIYYITLWKRMRGHVFLPPLLN